MICARCKTVVAEHGPIWGVVLCRDCVTLRERVYQKYQDVLLLVDLAKSTAGYQRLYYGWELADKSADRANRYYQASHKLRAYLDAMPPTK